MLALSSATHIARTKPPTAPRKLLPLHVLLLAAPALASDVLVVDPSSSTAFPSIQAAVDTASDGDVVLVRTGAHSGAVTIAGFGVSIIGDGAVSLDGAITVRDVPRDSFVLLGGLDGAAPANESLPGVHVDNCTGPVRILDCDFEGSRDLFLSLTAVPTGEGVLIEDSKDVALIDSQATGGLAGIYAGGFPASYYIGAPGVSATGVKRLSIVRSVCSGGSGMTDIFGTGQDGGHGALLVNCPKTWIAYSAFFGGVGGDGDAYPFSISGNGGDGLRTGGASEVWDFEGVFVGGFEGCSTSSFCVPGTPGRELSGTATIHPLDGFPTRLNSPLLVRTGETFTTQVVSEPDHPVRSLAGDATRATFRPAGLQPLLVRLPAARTLSPIGTTPANGRLDLTYTAGPIAHGEDAQVLWIQATVEEPGGAQRLSSARAMVIVDSAY